MNSDIMDEDSNENMDLIKNNNTKVKMNYEDKLNGDDDDYNMNDSETGYDDEDISLVENESDDDDDDNESDDDDDDDDEIEEEKLIKIIKLIKDKLLQNPYDYESYLDLIQASKVAGDFDELSLARNDMAKVYPLTPELWLEWINDEIKYFMSGSNDTQILELFEKATNDYVSCEVWLKRQDFCLDLKNKDLSYKRNVCDEVIENIGIHPMLGHQAWETYRKFEENNLINTEDKFKTLDKIFFLYQKQLSVPNVKLEETFENFKKFLAEVKEAYPNYSCDTNNFESIYKIAKDEFENLKKHEEELNVEDNLPAYYNYIEFEMKKKKHKRVKFIFERAITEHCLNAELWLKYLNYLKENNESYVFLKNVLLRATRNTTWCSVIWIEFIKISESFKIKDDEIQKIFENALESTFQTSEDYRNLWITYLDFRKRKTNFEDEKHIEKLRKNFEVGINHLNSMADGDPYFILPMYLAKIEAKFCSNMTKAREIWNEILNGQNGFNKDLMYWLDYAELEKYYGDNENYKKVMLKALNNCPESFNLLQCKLLNHFREEMNDLSEIEKVEQNIKKIYGKIITQKESLETNLRRNSKRKEFTSKNLQKNNKKAKIEDKKGKTEDKKAKIEDKKTKIEDKKSNIKRDNEGFVIPQTIDSNQPKVEFKKPDSDSNVLQTVIVKNLSFELDEQKIKGIFEKFGKIQDVRLVRKFNGKSKGFCYIEYTSIEEAKNAVKNDRYLINGRPAFISEINSNHEFKYKTELEKNKIFVSNLSPKTTEAKLKEIFSKYEGFKELRLGNYRNGHSKCIAYVEFISDNCASKALLQSDNLDIDGKKISVAISNPPKKKETFDVSTQRALGEVFGSKKKNQTFGKRRIQF